jgi:hypothetical protein
MSAVTEAFTGFVDKVKTNFSEGSAQLKEQASKTGNFLTSTSLSGIGDEIKKGVESGLKQGEVMTEKLVGDQKENVGGRRRKSKRKRTKRR